MATQAAVGVMERLKSETRELHGAAEQHEFNRNLFKGRLPREDYVRHLGQLLLVHRALEARLREARERVPAIASVVEEYQYQEPYLIEDLEFFGVDPATIEAQPATERLIRRINTVAEECPLALLGFHYVVEGSNNGGRFIARGIAKAYSLRPGPGLRYLDPYGDAQPQRWAEFKAEMGKVGFTDEEVCVLVDAAKEMFRAIAEIGDDLIAEPVA